MDPPVVGEGVVDPPAPPRRSVYDENDYTRVREPLFWSPMRAVSKHTLPGASRTCRYLFVCRKLSREKRGRLFPSAARRVNNITMFFQIYCFLFRLVLYYEEKKRELKRIHIYGCRCNERLRAKAEGSTRLTYNGLRGGLEHIKIETRLSGERFESVKGECVI